MDLLIVTVPLFNEESSVEAYMFQYNKGNNLLHAATDSISFDGAMRSPMLLTMNKVGLEALTMGKPIFIPVNKYMLMADLDRECSESPEKVVFLIDSDVISNMEFIDSIKRLKEKGYRFAVRGIDDDDESYLPFIAVCDYVFHDQRRFTDPNQVKFRDQLFDNYPDVLNVYTNIDQNEIFQSARRRYHGLFEGRFYRTPLSAGEKKVSPLQINMINLLNKVRTESFDFDEVARIIEKDPMLTVSLLRMVNTVSHRADRVEIDTISGAVVMLGQNEVRKWITAAATSHMAADKPSEVTKLALIRAKFCEAMAPHFGLGAESQSLFLLGIFSVLDVILEMDMEEALRLVLISKEISEALIGYNGKFGVVYRFIIDYESAAWNVVSRTMIIHEISADSVFDAYIQSLCWYRDLLDEEVKQLSKPGEQQAKAAAEEPDSQGDDSVTQAETSHETPMSASD